MNADPSGAAEGGAVGAAPGGRVVVVGSLNVDLVVRVVRLPVAGETVTGSDLERAAGGKGLNQAVAAARAGARVALVGAVGDDEGGRWLTGLAAAEGIDTSGVATVPGRATGSAVVLVDAEGANSIVVSPGANGAVATGRTSWGPDPRPGPGPGDVVLAQAEVPAPAVDAALRAGRAAGATTVVNQAPFRPLGPALWAAADVLVVNEVELASLVAAEVAPTAGAGPAEVALDPAGSGAPAERRAAAAAVGAGLLRRRVEEGGPAPSVLVVSLGAAGAIAVGPDGATREQPAERVDAVDTVGAGDCLAGWLAAGLVGRPPPCGPDEVAVALRRAVTAAGLSVQRRGAAASMPRGAEVPSGVGSGAPRPDR